MSESRSFPADESVGLLMNQTPAASPAESIQMPLLSPRRLLPPLLRRRRTSRPMAVGVMQKMQSIQHNR